MNSVRNDLLFARRRSQRLVAALAAYDVRRSEPEHLDKTGDRQADDGRRLRVNHVSCSIRDDQRRQHTGAFVPSCKTSNLFFAMTPHTTPAALQRATSPLPVPSHQPSFQVFISSSPHPTIPPSRPPHTRTRHLPTLCARALICPPGCLPAPRKSVRAE